MPIYNITVTPDPILEQEYRVEANSLEGAKEAASDAFYNQVSDLVVFEVEGELSDDQEGAIDFEVKDICNE